MRKLPFRARIAVLSAAVAGVGLAAFGFAAWWLVGAQKLESIDTEIRSLGARHPGWITARGNFQRLDEALAFIFGETHASNIILLVKDAGGKVLHTSAGWPGDLDANALDCRLEDDPAVRTATATNSPVFGTGPGRGRGGLGRGLGPGGGGSVPFTKLPRFQTVKTAAGEWRLGMLGTADTTLAIGLNHGPVRAEMRRLRNALWSFGTVVLTLVALGGWQVAGRAIHPLRTIADTAERVTASGLDARIPTAGEAPEIARVIEVLNRMMDRLEASFHQATRFGADASHELKTPLAIMQGELEAALQAAVPGSSEQKLFANLIEETHRLKDITRSLLLLARADAGRLNLARERLDLSNTLADLVEDARMLAPELGLEFQVDICPEVQFLADRTLLNTAIFNVISNAVKYNQPGGRVSVRLEQEGDKARLIIGNSGPVISPPDQPRVFERFFRAHRTSHAQVHGIGLGLSMAREIVGAHGGKLLLKQSHQGWTVFEFSLPLDASPLVTLS